MVPLDRITIRVLLQKMILYDLFIVWYDLASPRGYRTFIFVFFERSKMYQKKGVPSAESSRSVRGLGKGVSGKHYPRLCNARRPRLEPGTFRSQAVRLYRLHQARPSLKRK